MIGAAGTGEVVNPVEGPRINKTWVRLQEPESNKTWLGGRRPSI
jgi:hypothetical protein